MRIRQSPSWPHVTMALALLVASAGATAIFGQQATPGIRAGVLGNEPHTFVTAEQPRIRVVAVATGLMRPFGMAILPNGDALVTERGAGLRLVRGVTTASRPVRDTAAVTGLPEIPAFRGGGLQDVVLHPRFAENRFVYVTYNKAGEPGGTPGQRPGAVAIARARLDGERLTQFEELYVAEWRAGASGSRLAFGRDDLLYVTTGAPFGDEAQNLGSAYGKVLRLRDDGSVPGDNPFAGRAGARAEIFSYGHRDQLGLTVHPTTGAVLAVDHGPNGGDELNLILPGRNYGWPLVTYGRTYEGPRMTAAAIAEGIEEPIVVWLPSIAPTGLTFYDGDRFPAWRGNLFVGSARRGQIPGTGGLERVVFNDALEELRRETLLTPLHRRIRDVRQGPDGLLYVLSDDEDGALLRIEPAD